jgi:hypothetical protein
LEQRHVGLDQGGVEPALGQGFDIVFRACRGTGHRDQAGHATGPDMGARQAGRGGNRAGDQAAQAELGFARRSGADAQIAGLVAGGGHGERQAEAQR